MKSRLKPIAIAVALTLAGGAAQAADFYLAAKSYTKTLPNGTTVPMWGYVEDTGNGTAAHCHDLSVKVDRKACVDSLPDAAVPGPRMDLTPNDTTLRVYLTNALPEPTSIIIPGREMPFSGGSPGPTWNDGAIGARTSAAQRVRSFGAETSPNGGKRFYIWSNGRGNAVDRSGTFIYQSGTWPQKQVYMGLSGMVTRDSAAGEAYPGVGYDNEVVLFYSDIDPGFNQAVANGTLTTAADRHPSWFLVNGSPYYPVLGDITAGTDGSPLKAGETTLLRFASIATDTHVVVLQGMDMSIHAEDGLPYSYQDSSGTPVAAISRRQYSVMLPPAKTKDATVVAPGFGRYAVYDGNGYLTNPSDPNDPNSGDEVGGMLRFLNFHAGTNQAPTALADTASVVTGSSVVIPVVNNDTDPENDPLTIHSVVTTGILGRVNCDSTGCTYDAGAVPGGTTETFSYTATDGTNSSNAATVTVIVSANLPPVVADDTGATTTDTAVIIDVLANDSDPEGSALTVAAFDAVTVQGGMASCGTTLGATCTYTPPAGFAGNDSFTYMATDGINSSAPATVTLTVSSPNLPPLAVGDTATTERNTQVIIDVLANDSDPEGSALNIDGHDMASTQGGSIACATSVVGGSCAYTPPVDFSGTDTFGYVTSDGVNTAATTVTVTVNGPGAPVLQFSTAGAGSVPGVSGPYDDADLYSVDAGGTYVRSYDAVADLGLPNDANIDGLSINGNLTYVSFAGASTTVPGIGQVPDEDVVVYDTTTGIWNTYFDDTVCGLDASSGQDVDAISVSNGVLYFSTLAGGANSPVGGVSGADDADIYTWNGGTLGRANCGREIRGTFGQTNMGLPANADIDGLTVRNGLYYMSFNLNRGMTVPGLGVVQDESVASYDPTTGAWTLVYSGTGLNLTNSQDVDAIYIP